MQTIAADRLESDGSTETKLTYLNAFGFVPASQLRLDETEVDQ